MFILEVYISVFVVRFKIKVGVVHNVKMLNNTEKNRDGKLVIFNLQIIPLSNKSGCAVQILLKETEDLHLYVICMCKQASYCRVSEGRISK